MPNRIIGPVAAFIILVAAQGGLAQVNVPKIYVGVGVGTLSYNEDDEEIEEVSVDLSIYALSLRLGVDFNKYLSAELRGSIGLNEDTDSTRVAGLDINLTSKVETILGIHARLSMPTNSPVTPYAMLGYARLEASGTLDILEGNFSLAKVSAEDSMSEVSYGVGVDMALGVIRLNAEYARYDEINALSIGIVRGF